MIVIESIREMRLWSREAHGRGETVGLVPTMGYLHEGHRSLMRVANDETDRVVVSIFVNPTQFGPGEDLERYPRDSEGDLAKCRAEGVAAVFMPRAAEMYPEGYATYVEVEGLTKGLCGAARPGHFRGVATVVAKLFTAVQPDAAVFGQKDYQQLQVLRRMNEDLGFGIDIIGAPIVREPDGLAMSSRNVYLKPDERRAATVLHRALGEARAAFEAGERKASALRERVRARIAREPLAELDYVEALHPERLAPIEEITDGCVIAVAARFPSARLIDNVVLREAC